MSRALDGRVLRWTLIAGVFAIAAAVIALVVAPDRRAAEVGTAQQPATASEHAAPAAQADATSAERIATVDATELSAVDELDEPAVAAVAPTPTFWGRVIDAETVAPIAGALVESVDSPRWARTQQPASTPAQARTDAGGLFELELPADAYDSAWVQARGFGRACFSLDSAHATPERALEIVLSRAGQVEAHVRDGSGAPLVGANVRIFTSARRLARPEGSRVFGDDCEWLAATDWQGVARLVDLAADVPLSVEVRPTDAESPTRFRDVVLERGELRVCDWTLGDGSRITGELLAQDGRALARQELWLTNALALNWKQRASCFFDDQDGDKAFAKATTDDLGHFEITGVPRGRWWIGPALRPTHAAVFRATRLGRRVVVMAESGERERLDPLAPCAVATQIEVDGVRPLDLTLRVQCGLYITGRVLDPQGQPYGSIVHAHGLDVGGPLDANEIGDGNFVIGPLPLGRFALWAEGFQDVADSEELFVDAGATDVELRLRRSCKFAGKLSGARPGDSEYHAFAVNQVGIAIVPLHDDGSFELGGMAPGKYDLVASGINGWFGAVRGATFEGGPVEIAMRPGARLRIHYDGPASQARVKVYDDAGLVAFDVVDQGASNLCTVPPGRLRVELRVDESPPQQREVFTAVGDEAKVDFKFD